MAEGTDFAEQVNYLWTELDANKKVGEHDEIQPKPSMAAADASNEYETVTIIEYGADWSRRDAAESELKNIIQTTKDVEIKKIAKRALLVHAPYYVEAPALILAATMFLMITVPAILHYVQCPSENYKNCGFTQLEQSLEKLYGWEAAHSIPPR